MTASTLIDVLAGRGLVLSIVGARIRAYPRSLLTDEDRHLISQFRDDLFLCIAERQAARDSVKQGERRFAPKPPVSVYRRPDEIAMWPLADRQRWGELANELEDKGLDWREAEQRAYVTVLAEREVTGKIFLFVEDHPSPDPFPEWDELIEPRAYLPDQTRLIRPPGHPTWGVTAAIRVVELARWTASRQAKDPVYLVTAEGWGRWFPVEPGDLPPTNGLVCPPDIPCLWPSKPPRDLDDLDAPEPEGIR